MLDFGETFGSDIQILRFVSINSSNSSLHNIQDISNVVLVSILLILNRFCTMFFVSIVDFEQGNTSWLCIHHAESAEFDIKLNTPCEILCMAYCFKH